MPTSTSRTAVVIPARYASSRFPGKPLAEIAGVPMIIRVLDQARASTAEHVLVATDDDRIADCVRSHGGTVVMTADDHPSGTDRVYEAVKDIDADLVINLQCDEPLLPPALIDELISAMGARPEADMATIAVPLAADSDGLNDPNIVKVVLDKDGYALYFSRAPIPFERDSGGSGPMPLHHWGIYAFRRSTLEQYVTWPPSPLEMCEKLEQLRALEHGRRIFVHVTDATSIGVDQPADIAKVEAILAQEDSG